ncbi:MAG: pentapeptide repeat-containing protein [Spirochaetota bacterium]
MHKKNAVDILNDIVKEKNSLYYDNIEISGNLDLTQLRLKSQHISYKTDKEIEIIPALFFINCRFNGKLICNKKENNSVLKMIFKDEISFENSVFLDDVDFSEAVFMKKVNFNNTRFEKKVTFSKALFKDLAYFDNIYPLNKIILKGAVFERSNDDIQSRKKSIHEEKLYEYKRFSQDEKDKLLNEIIEYLNDNDIKKAKETIENIEDDYLKQLLLNTIENKIYNKIQLFLQKEAYEEAIREADKIFVNSIKHKAITYINQEIVKKVHKLMKQNKTQEAKQLLSKIKDEKVKQSQESYLSELNRAEELIRNSIYNTNEIDSKEQNKPNNKEQNINKNTENMTEQIGDDYLIDDIESFKQDKAKAKEAERLHKEGNIKDALNKLNEINDWKVKQDIYHKIKGINKDW